MMYHALYLFAIFNVQCLAVDGSLMLRSAANRSGRFETSGDRLIKDTTEPRSSFLGRFLCGPGPLKVGCAFSGSSSTSSTSSASSSASSSTSTSTSSSTNSEAAAETNDSGNTKSGHDDSLSSDRSALAWMAALGAAVAIAALLAAKKRHLEKNLESDNAIEIMESAAAAPDTSVSSFINAVPLTKAPSIVKAPSLTKAPSIVKAPSLTKAPSIVKAPSLTKAPSIVKAPSLTKALSIVKAPSLAQASTFLKSPSITKGITHVSDRNLLDCDSLMGSDVSVSSLDTAAATAVASVSDNPANASRTTFSAVVIQKVKGIPGKVQNFRSLLSGN